MKASARYFISTAHEMTLARQACQAAAESPRKKIALAHYRAAEAAFANDNDTACLEECRAAVDALE